MQPLFFRVSACAARRSAAAFPRGPAFVLGVRGAQRPRVAPDARRPRSSETLCETPETSPRSRGTRFETAKPTKINRAPAKITPKIARAPPKAFQTRNRMVNVTFEAKILETSDNSDHPRPYSTRRKFSAAPKRRRCLNNANPTRDLMSCAKSDRFRTLEIIPPHNEAKSDRFRTLEIPSHNEASFLTHISEAPTSTRPADFKNLKIKVKRAGQQQAAEGEHQERQRRTRPGAAAAHPAAGGEVPRGPWPAKESHRRQLSRKDAPPPFLR